MKKRNLAVTVALTLSCSLAFADPVAHKHGDRPHSHNLPANGMAHNHGGLPATNAAHKNNHQARKPTARLVPMSALTPQQKNKVLALSQLGGVTVLKTIVPKYNTGILGLSGHKAEAKRDIKIACTGYARRLQQGEKQVNLYSYVLNNCVQTAYKVIKFDGASVTAARSTSSNNPASSAKDKVVAKLREKAKTEVDKLGDKMGNELKKAFGGFF